MVEQDKLYVKTALFGLPETTMSDAVCLIYHPSSRQLYAGGALSPQRRCNAKTYFFSNGFEDFLKSAAKIDFRDDDFLELVRRTKGNDNLIMKQVLGIPD